MTKMLSGYAKHCHIPGLFSFDRLTWMEAESRPSRCSHRRQRTATNCVAFENHVLCKWLMACVNFSFVPSTQVFPFDYSTSI